MAGYKYWRIEFSGADTLCLNHVELLETLYGPTIFRAGTGYTLTGSGTNASFLLGTTLNDANGWIMGASSGWIEVSTTVDVWVDAVAMWRSQGKARPNSVTVKRSSNGTSWVTEWVDNTFADETSLYRPCIAKNPNPLTTPTSTPLVLRSGALQYDLNPAGAAYSDAGSTPIVDGRGVRQLANTTGYSGAATAFVQSSAGNRPVWRASGINGLPYLAMTGAEWFESVAFTQPSGFAMRPWSAIAVMNNAARTGFPSFWGGVGATNGGKAGFHLRPGNPDQEVHLFKNANRRENYTSSTRVIGASAASISGLSFCFAVDGSGPTMYTASTNPDLTGITQAAVLWRGDGDAGNMAFAGDLYRLLIIDGGNPIDLWLASHYCMGKYVFGFEDKEPPPPPPVYYRRRPAPVVNF